MRPCGSVSLDFRPDGAALDEAALGDAAVERELDAPVGGRAIRAAALGEAPLNARPSLLARAPVGTALGQLSQWYHPLLGARSYRSRWFN